MSEETDRGYWVTSAADIKMDNIDSQLYVNDSIEDFLSHKFFIIAEKGIGKTLLLKKKKYDLLQKKSGAIFIPSRQDLDIPAEFKDLSKNVISFLEDLKIVKSLWTLAIQLSAIKNSSSYEEFGRIKDRLPDLYIQIFDSGIEYLTPSEVFHKLIKNVPQVLQYIKNYTSIVDALYNFIRVSIYIFIDRLDQAMLYNCTQEMWMAMQAGLLEAAWDLREHNHHVKIFCSIRKEAYIEYRSEIKSNLSGQVCFLHYRKDELQKLVTTLSRYYEGGKTIEDIVGFGDDGKFIHPKTGNEETVFEYILRHTVAKPRDLIRIASTLKARVTPSADNETKIEELRTTINEAARKVAEDIFVEKARFLDCLQNEKARNRFLSLIPKNTLNQQTVYDICRAFNGKSVEECSKKQCLTKGTDGCVHPFCELNSIGLFGNVSTDTPVIQKFKDPDANSDPDMNKANHITGLYSYYVVHPSLCEIIKELRFQNGVKYIVTPGITTGNGYKWNKRDSDISELVDFVLSAELPDEKEKEIMLYLKDTVKNTKDINELSIKIKQSIEKKIFLSYCGKDEDIVNSIDVSLKKMCLKITRDKRDLSYKANVVKFMQSLREHDYVITVVSDSYLKSKNCMFEIGELLGTLDYREKTLQIILPDADIFNDINKYNYIEYWTIQKQELESKLSANLSNNNLSMITNDIKDYEGIINNLPNFLGFVRSEKGMLLSDLEGSGYKTLLKYMEKEKRLG